MMQFARPNQIKHNCGGKRENWKSIQVRKLFKGGNYLREETIQGRKLFKGGNY